MKMSKELFSMLSDAIDATLSCHTQAAALQHRNTVKYTNSQFIAFCWSVFHASKFDCTKLYNADLNDTHIETALKRILSDYE